jgi:hypothetical protein
MAQSRIVSPVRRPYSLSCLRDSRPLAGPEATPRWPHHRTAQEDRHRRNYGFCWVAVGMKHVIRHDAILGEMAKKFVKLIYTYSPRHVIGIP